MAFNTGEFAKSQLEWMSDAISRQFDLQRSNPFEMKHVAMVHSLEELQALEKSPKVVLATDLSLDYGFSKALLLAWAADPLNLVLLTQRGHGDSVARELLRGVKAQADGKAAAGTIAASVVAQQHVQRVVVEVSVISRKFEKYVKHVSHDARTQSH
jgi:Cft2 family RNA processing exonuclease